jgi:hypothetical protein
VLQWARGQGCPWNERAYYRAKLINHA